MTTRIDPLVLDCQVAFRSLLACLASPGTIGELPPYRAMEAWTWDPYLAEVVMTLLDGQTGFAVGDGWGAEVAAEIRDRTNARVVSPAEADYLLADGGRWLPELGSLCEGTLEYPDRSATAILLVRLVEPKRWTSPDSGVRLDLSGPGIPESASIYASGLAPMNLTQLVAKNQTFPLGIDTFLVDLHGHVAGLPRTVQMRWEPLP